MSNYTLSEFFGFASGVLPSLVWTACDRSRKNHISIANIVYQ